MKNKKLASAALGFAMAVTSLIGFAGIDTDIVRAETLGLMEDGSVEINHTNFPDPTFYNTLNSIKYDPDSDYIITADDLKKITSFEFEDSGIKNLKGIQFFSSLKSLKVDTCDIEDLDVSGCSNLEVLQINNCSHLKTLNVSKNKKLKIMTLVSTTAETFDASKLDSIEILALDNCPNIESISITNKSNLSSAFFKDCEKLSEIKFANNASVQTVSVRNVPELAALKLDNCPKVDNLTVSDCPKLLETLDFADCPNLVDTYNNPVDKQDKKSDLGEDLIIYVSSPAEGVLTGNLTIPKACKPITEKAPATPTPTVKVTATPTPTVKVTSTPTPTPKATATPTPTPTVTQTPEEKSKTQIMDFVKRIYIYVLDREPEEKGAAFWSNELLEFKKTGAEVAQGFIFSPEFEARNTTDEEFVTILYKTFFGRDPEDEGKAFWLNQLATKTMDRVTVANGFIYSQEWADTCASYGIRSGGDLKPSGDIEPTQLTYDFVERMYTTALGRGYDEAGKQYWAGELANFNITGEQVGASFFLSDEMVNYRLSDAEYLSRLYATFMNREPDESGSTYWFGVMASGTSRAEIVLGFTRSPEFTEKCIEARILPY